MIEMHMENQRVERLRLRQLGEDWIRAITEGALERLEQYCQPEIHSRLLSPTQFVTFDTSTDLMVKAHQWFGECSDFQIEQSRVEMVGERLVIFYRFFLQEQGGWFTVEQQLYCTMKDGRIAQLDLLCSGFQPVEFRGLPEPMSP